MKQWAYIKELVLAVMKKDPAATSFMATLLYSPGIRALAAHRKTHTLWQKGKKLRALRIAYKARRRTGIEIHPGATLGRRIVIDHGMGVVIGETAILGDDVLLFHGVTLGGLSSQKGAKRHPTVGSHVLLGAGSTILGNITIGEGAKVGAHALVLHDVPSGATAVGCTGRTIAREEKDWRAENEIALAQRASA